MAGGAAGDYRLVARERVEIEARVLLHQIHMPVGLDRRAGAPLWRQRRLHPMFLQHGDDRISDSVVEVIRGASMEVSHSAGLARRAARDQVGIAVTQVPLG